MARKRNPKTAPPNPSEALTPASLSLPSGYDAFLTELKDRIRAAQLRAALAVNRELVLLYWQTGRDILRRQQEHGWGAKVIDRLAADLHHAFPEVRGFSPRNLKYMRAFAQAWPDEAIVQQLLAQIPWGHNVRLLDHVADPAERECYIRKTIEHGWSRSIREHQIESGLYRRQGQAVTNFSRTLPPPQSDLAQQALKDPYNFDFLTLGNDAHERALERGLLEHLRQFLLELGVGFAFVGSQVHREVDGQDFYLDLLQAMNRAHLERAGGDDRIEGVIESYELAFRMQAAAPKLTDLSGESKATLALYGINEKPTDDFGRQCLLARRFAEAGVRFI